MYMEDNWDLDDDEDFTLMNYNSLKKIRIDFIEEKKDEHKYLAKWFDLVSSVYSKLREDPNYHSFFNHNELKKELTESYSIYKQFKRVLSRLFIQNEIKSKEHKKKQLHEASSKVVVFDIGSGKAVAFPKMQVYMVDKDTSINLSHTMKLRNVKFVNMDVKKDKFHVWMDNKMKSFEECGKLGIILGVHLCGILSIDFVNIYKSYQNIKAMVLAPCCLSKTMRNLTTLADKLKVDSYNFWTMYLYNLVSIPVDSGSIHERCSCSKDIREDDEVLSARNNFICAIKNPNCSLHKYKTS